MEMQLHESVTRQRVTTPSLLDFANQNRNDSLFCDVTIQSGDETISANKLVLCCFSRRFKEIFKANTREPYNNNVSLPTVDGETFKLLIDFIYTGSITISSQNVMFLLSGADYLQLNDVKQFCFEFLQSNVTPDSCLEILTSATLYSNEELKSEIQQYISENLLEVEQTKTFKNLSKDDLLSFVGNLDRNQTEEKLIFQALVTWSHYDETRKKDFSELFRLVDFKNMKIEFLEEVVLEEDLVKSNSDCEKFALRSYRELAISQKSDISAALQTTDLKESKIVSFGGSNLRKVEVVHDLLCGSTTEYPSLPKELRSHSVLNFKNVVYCLGGVEPDNHNFVTSSKVWKIDLNSQLLTWEQIASLNEERRAFGAAVFNDTLVVTGGCNKSQKALASTEFYVAPIDEWQTISPLNQQRQGHAFLTCGRFLYALGGFDYPKVLTSVERLDHLKSAWTDITPMPTPRSYFTAVTYENDIYAMGGRRSEMINSAQKSVEKFDTVKELWKRVSDMKHARQGHAACTLRGKIYVIGGKDENLKVVKEIECYDPPTDTWSVVGTTEDELYEQAVAVL